MRPALRGLHMVCTTALLVLLVSCTSIARETGDRVVANIPFRIISGTVLYPNNLYFPARVRLEITLSSRNTASRQESVLVTQSIRNPQRFPVNFILRYDEKDILSSDEHYVSIMLYRESESEPYLSSTPVPLPALSGDENIVVELKPPTQ